MPRKNRNAKGSGKIQARKWKQYITKKEKSNEKPKGTVDH